MKRKVLIRSEAERDLADAAAWYKQQRLGLGREFVDEARRLLDSIAEAPLLYQVVHRGTRRAVMRRFPFGFFYRVDESVIVLVAVLHCSRDPRRWKRRR